MPSRDHFSMDRVAFPRRLRERIADAELRKDRGELTSDDFDASVRAWVEAAMADHGLTYAEGWMWYETPPARHNPSGLTMVWWRFR